MKTCLFCEGVSATEQELCSSCGTPLLATSEVHFPLRRGEDDAAHPLIGARIDGKYRITNVLGKGGMGTVFRAVHEVSLVPVALKVLHPRFAQNAEHRAYFLAEARKAGRVVHENSARIQDVGEAEDGTVYLAMELVQGVTLHDWMRSGVQGPEVIVAVLDQICSALTAAHEVGLVHRDLTPKNVMVVAKDGLPAAKILDFGIAKGPPLRSERGEAHTFGAPAGFANPPYSAPEHLLGQEVDARADLYSVGVIAYEMLAGRSPVAGTTVAELAEETIAGRIRPLLPRKKTPQRLLRLVQALLARDPRARPASASEVKRTLARIRESKAPWLPSASVLATLVGVAAVVLAWSSREAPYLTGSSLALRATPPSAESEVAYLRTEALRELHFDYGGFALDDLRLFVQQGPVERRKPLLARREATGRLVLAVADDPELARLYEAVVGLSAHGFVDLAFAIPARAPLGYARVVLDDTPPVVGLEVDSATVASNGYLNGSSTITLTLDDTIGMRDATLEASGKALGEGVVRRLPQDASLKKCTLDVRRVLSSCFPGVEPSPDVRLVLKASDRAGNEASSAPLLLPGVDLRVGQVTAATAPEGGKILTIGPSGARLSLTIDEWERRLAVLVRDPDGDESVHDRPEEIGERGLEIVLKPKPGSRLRDDKYELRLRDAAGNVGASVSFPFTFRSEALDEALRVEAASARTGALLGRRVVTDGTSVGLELTCNELYRPQRIALFPARPSDAPALEPGALLSAAAYGSARVGVPALTPGDHRLHLDFEDRRGEPGRGLDVEVTALPAAVVVSVPSLRGARFLQELTTLGVLRRVGDHVVPGLAWNMIPPDPRLVHGSVFHGAGELALLGPTSPESADAPLFARLPLLRGENALALALFDPLGRPVRVQIGDRQAETVVAGGMSASLALRFWHDDAAPEPLVRPIPIEHGQGVDLVLRTALPFRDAQDRGRIDLVLDGPPIAPDLVRTTATGAELKFRLPFERIVAAAKLSDLEPADYAGPHDAALPARLRTPAGDFELGLAVRTSRSLLVSVTLAEVCADPALLPQELLEIRMVPVPGPLAASSWVDPVPSAHAGRDSFRPDPAHEVRGLTAFYLQSGELTRAQHAAIVRAFSSLPPSARPSVRDLVHAADPLREQRLTARGLLPHVSAGSDAVEKSRAHMDLVDLGPDRPVTGLDWFQTYTAARICAFLIGNVEIVRLPLGVELEWAALGTHALADRPRWHGASDVAGELLAAHLRSEKDLDDHALWPPTEAQSIAAGDYVSTVLDDRIAALDFGVREWTLDLPYDSEAPQAALLLEWLGDAARHLEHARDFALGRLKPAELAPALSINAVVRGLGLGELPRLGEFARGMPVGVPLDPRVPGVVRTVYIRRNGGDPLPGRYDPRLFRIGFRLCGGIAFVTAVRSR